MVSRHLRRLLALTRATGRSGWSFGRRMIGLPSFYQERLSHTSYNEQGLSFHYCQKPTTVIPSAAMAHVHAGTPQPRYNIVFTWVPPSGPGLSDTVIHWYECWTCNPDIWSQLVPIADVDPASRRLRLRMSSTSKVGLVTRECLQVAAKRCSLST